MTVDEQAALAGEPYDALAELNNEKSRILLDTIDSLRELQVGDIVPLPQIIVVGDQSSGKSSVLEAISRVRFPVDSKLCTRFATELVLRRAENTRVAVSIRYAGGSNSSGDAEPFRRTDPNLDSLPEIIDAAKTHMGITGTPKDGKSPKRFSKDVLRIEISRPDVYSLTLVDLPGIFHNETADQTEQDKTIVNQLIDSYMRQEKSIILAVVMATNQLANQEVVKLARKHDPQRKRTVGVITKADLSHEEGVTQQFVDVVKGLDPTHKFGLGWFVLRNLSEKQKLDGLTFDDRDAVETEFFQTANGWSSVLKTNRGIQSLRKALSGVLLEHIKVHLPAVVTQIENELNSRRKAQRRLGTQRTSFVELQSYMHNVSKEFSRLTNDGVNGRYADDFFDAGEEEGPRKFRSNLRKLNRAFYAVLREKGAEKTILTETDASSLSSDQEDAAEERSKANAVPDYLRSFVEQYRNFPHPEPISPAEFDRDLEQFAANNQGRELSGVPNSALAIDLFRRQSKPWRGIARFHLDLVLKFAKSFVEDVFTHVIGDDTRTLMAVLNIYSDPFFEKKRDVLEAKLDEILRPYTDGNGLPLETEFRDSLYKTGQLRFGQKVVAILEKEHPEVFAGDEGLSRDELLFSIQKSADVPNSEFGTEQIIDMMLTYYDMSRRTFTENVINLVVENCLMCDIPEVLTTDTVFKMTEDRLRELASESEDVVAERSRLEDEIKILEQGLSRCRLYKPRTTTVLLSSPLSVKPSPVPTVTRRPGTSTPSHTSAATERKRLLNQDSTNQSPSTQSPFGGGASAASSQSHLGNSTNSAPTQSKPTFGVFKSTQNTAAPSAVSFGSTSGSTGKSPAVLASPPPNPFVKTASPRNGTLFGAAFDQPGSAAPSPPRIDFSFGSLPAKE